MSASSRKRLLAFSPHSENLVAAAMVFRDGDRFVTAGAKEIVKLLVRWAEKPPADHVVILLNDVQDGKESRKALKELHRKGVAVTWVGASKYGRLSDEFFRDTRVEYALEKDLLVSAASLFKTPEAVAPIVRAFHAGNAELFEALNYLTARCLMKFGDPEPLEQAVRWLSHGTGKQFNPRNFDAAFVAATARYREADFPYLEGKTEAVLEMKDRIHRIAPTDLSPLIIGETGTGKEAVAFFLHDFSNRRGKPFVALNCAGLSEDLLRSELFGHVKGAFTGADTDRHGLVASADGGTLFLDEITEMPLPIQADLLRFLQTRRYRRLGEHQERGADIRIVTAAQPELRKRLRSGAFRKDLYYRVADVEIFTPALRTVSDDIIRVIRYFLFRSFLRGLRQIDIQKELKYFDGGLDLLRTYSWPGNYRELISLLKRRIALGDDVLAEVRTRMADPVPCGDYDLRPEDLSRSQGVSMPPGLDAGMAALVEALPALVSSEEIGSAYIRAVREKFPLRPLRELAKEVQLSENTFRSRLNPGKGDR